MTLRQFYDWQTLGGAKDVMRLVTALEEREISWCMIGGLAVNHWALEEIFTRNVDFVTVSAKIREITDALGASGFNLEKAERILRFKGNSNVAIGLHTTRGILDLSTRSVPANVHGMLMRVASLEDTLGGKIAAFSAPERRGSKRMKDLLDISRLLEAHPELKQKIPLAILEKLEV